jgi:hypothetical protein
VAASLPGDPARGLAGGPAGIVAYLTAGRARLTLSGPGLAALAGDGADRYTYEVGAPRNGGDVRFLRVLTGPDNEADYTYGGALRDVEVRTRFAHGEARVEIDKMLGHLGDAAAATLGLRAESQVTRGLGRVAESMFPPVISERTEIASCAPRTRFVSPRTISLAPVVRSSTRASARSASWVNASSSSARLSARRRGTEW